MATLLHIQSSPNGAQSTSVRVARALLDAYAAHHHGDEVVELDLWETDLPEFDATAVAAQNKVLARAPHSREEAQVWRRVTALCDQFMSADKIVVSCPMWNFSIPYKLKHYIDVITQPGITFGWSPEDGYTGLVTGKPVQLVLTRAGAYTPPSPKEWMDHQTNYLRFLFEFLGLTDIRTLAVEPTLLQGPEVAAASLRAGIDAAREAASVL